MAKGGLLQRMLRRSAPGLQARGRVLRKFADKIGLVYFGTVDQHHDDHEVIRGLTISTTHHDTHYAVGSFNGYDVSLVDRFDVVTDRTGIQQEHSWVIFQINLKIAKDTPHLFLRPLGHSPASYDKFFTAFRHLQAVNSMFTQPHTAEFHQRYELYTSSTHALIVESLFTPAITQTIAARFWPHAVEVLNGKLYVYTTEDRLSETVLGALLESAVWLAESLDQQSS